MVQIKRKDNDYEHLNEEPKKSKIELAIHTSLENLSNELFYEIFEYLDGYCIFSVFFKLNNRFKTLLNDPSLLLKVKLSPFITSSMKFYRDFLLPNRDRLLSVYLEGSSFIDIGFFNFRHPQSTIDSIKICYFESY